jgi:hypothetical protein
MYLLPAIPPESVIHVLVSSWPAPSLLTPVGTVQAEVVILSFSTRDGWLLAR